MADRGTSIRASQLRNFSITAEDIQNNSLTGNKLIDSTVSGAKIADGTITEAKLDISNEPADGYYLQYTDASGFTWSAGTVSGGGGGVSDHGALTGLENDDHSQYVLADGSRAITGDQTISGSLTTGDYIEIPADKAYYAGDTTTSGSWRIRIDGDDFVFNAISII
jgi:hypothetical protein